MGISEEDNKEEKNKKDSNEDEDKDEVGIMVCELSNQPDRPADWSSQIDKSGLGSAEELEEINKKKDHEMTLEEGSEEEENDILKRIRMMFSKLQTTSSRIDELRIELAEYSSQIDKSGLELTDEIEEIRTTEKQKVKECERQEMTEQDAELVNQEVKNKTINNVLAGNDEPFGKVLMPEIIMPAKTLENERAKLERKEMVKDKCDDQIFHPAEDIIERDDENQKERLDTQDTNEPFQNHEQNQAKQKMNGRTGLEDLR